MQHLFARCEGVCAQRLALHDDGRLRRLPCVALGSVASPKLAPVTLRFTPAQTTAMSQSTMCAARTDSPPCATQRHRGAPGEAHTGLRRLVGIPAFVHQLPLLRGWGCAAGRSLWRREAQGRGRHAQRASLTCSPQLFERRARSAQSEFCGAPPARASQRRLSVAQPATV